MTVHAWRPDRRARPTAGEILDEEVGRSVTTNERRCSSHPPTMTNGVAHHPSLPAAVAQTSSGASCSTRRERAPAGPSPCGSARRADRPARRIARSWSVGDRSLRHPRRDQPPADGELHDPDGDLRHADEWLHTPGYRLPQRRTGEERQMDPAAAVRQPGVRVRRLPAGDGSASPDHRLLRLLADRRAAPISIALGTPRAANRGGDGRGAGGASATALGGTGMERSGAWDLLQAARDRYGEEPREHDGAARAGHRLPAPPPSRQRRAAPALRRADRR